MQSASSFSPCLWLFPAPPAQAAADDQTLYEGDSIYHHITIRQDGTERCMIFGRQRDLRQTCIDLEKPDASVFEYTSMMFAGFLFRPDAKKVCLIGLGGGYIPTVFRMHLPQVELQTVEVDPLVEKLAKQYFGFSVPAGQTLAIDDGRQFLKKSRERYDQIWLDAFNSDYIPAHMTTKEFLHAGQVAPDGRRDRHPEPLLRQQPLRRPDRDLPVGLRQGLRLRGAEKRELHHRRLRPTRLSNPRGSGSRRRSWGGRIGRIDLVAEAGKMQGLPRPSKKAPILTDDYNPANLLLMQKK